MRYLIIANCYKELEENPSRLKKIEILSDFLSKLRRENNKEIIYLVQGRVFPDYNTKELGVSSQLIKKAISKSIGASEEKITNLWKKLGDLGLVAEELVKTKQQRTLSSKQLDAEKVIENLRKLSEFVGKGTVEKKLSLIAELLTSASPLEAKYIVRTVLSDLRIGVGEGTLRDAIVNSCFPDKEKKQSSVLVQEAYDKTTDFFYVFKKACSGEKSLKNIELVPGTAVKVMLFLKEENIKDAFKRVGKPAAFEYKYDGFRMMINKTEDKEIKIFTRRLEEVTAQFPEVVEYAKNNINAKTFIIDSEAVGFDLKTKKYRPFQEISQRIKRKYNIEGLQKKLPVEINVFDVIYYNGKNLLNAPFKKRREIIEKIISEEKWKIVLSKQIITSDEKKAEKFYEKALEEGHEGLMIKNLESEYKPGSRVGSGVKLKPEADDFDLVVTGAEYGTGKRAGWLTSFDVSCRHQNKFLEIGRVSTGLKEKEEQGLSYKEMTKKAKALITKSKGKHVEIKPEIVVTVAYQNIQKSPTYSSGFALRFPRFKKLRQDRIKSDIATLDEIRKRNVG
ncbi:MAG: ATP-dependent DNA ligase [Nanoarchaeota archaeon]